MNILNFIPHIEEDLLDVSVQVNTIESLSRILLEIMLNGENLKEFDASTLTKVILERTIHLKDSLNIIEKNLKI